jgi:hypothetical protein
MLRRYERLAGAPYGIDAVHAVPYLALVGADKDVAYLDDQRANLDLAVRMSAMSLLATALTVAFLWNDGWWMMIALIPYGMAYLLYRGAIVAAQEYGVAMAALIALNRFALYERMHLSLPSSVARERKRQDLTQQLLLSKAASGAYVHPKPEDSALLPVPSYRGDPT